MKTELHRRSIETSSSLSYVSSDEIILNFLIQPPQLSGPQTSGLEDRSILYGVQAKLSAGMSALQELWTTLQPSPHAHYFPSSVSCKTLQNDLLPDIKGQRNQEMFSSWIVITVKPEQKEP